MCTAFGKTKAVRHLCNLLVHSILFLVVFLLLVKKAELKIQWNLLKQFTKFSIVLGLNVIITACVLLPCFKIWRRSLV